jgi:hypothetical protein
LPTTALEFAIKNTILSRVSFVVAWPLALYCYVPTLLLNLAAAITPQDENLHPPNIPRDAEGPNSSSSHKVRIVDRRNQQIGSLASVSFGAQPV